ncbi:hypothetical protein JZK55_09250 [Dissulfurispira thermophila]|uniref:Uncharacterized protein n=1 Tax=Dissulfurispira thermophila TaxID=2715679 RepID=A0A7G1H1H8_9BACT|nr:hypothetical protein JZK55_09250 [Dissulfurispira thermophila]
MSLRAKGEAISKTRFLASLGMTDKVFLGETYYFYLCFINFYTNNGISPDFCTPDKRMHSMSYIT